MAKKRGNNEGSISHRKDGRWEARSTIHTMEGSKRKVLYGRTRAEVSAKLTKAMADRDGGIVFDSGGATVGDYLDRWLADSVRGTVRESTFSRDKYLVTNHIKPALGRLKLTNLNALHLQVSIVTASTRTSRARRSRRYTTSCTRRSLRRSSGTSSPVARRTR